MDDTVVHLTDYVTSVLIIQVEQTRVTPVNVTDRLSVLTTHQTRPVVPDKKVTVAQQTTYLKL